MNRVLRIDGENGHRLFAARGPEPVGPIVSEGIAVRILDPAEIVSLAC